MTKYFQIMDNFVELGTNLSLLTILSATNGIIL